VHGSKAVASGSAQSCSAASRSAASFSSPGGGGTLLSPFVDKRVRRQMPIAMATPGLPDRSPTLVPLRNDSSRTYRVGRCLAPRSYDGRRLDDSCTIDSERYGRVGLSNSDNPLHSTRSIKRSLGASHDQEVRWRFLREVPLRAGDFLPQPLVLQLLKESAGLLGCYLAHASRSVAERNASQCILCWRLKNDVRVEALLDPHSYASIRARPAPTCAAFAGSDWAWPTIQSFRSGPK
jgi:hypothetical protein